MAESVARICEAPLEEGWIPGRKAGYHPTSGMTILAELVRRSDGRDFDQYAVDEVFLPLGMPDCTIGMSSDLLAAKQARLGVMHMTVGKEPLPLHAINDPGLLSRVVPGAGGRGPMHQLVRFYECLLGKGERGGVRIASTQTIEAMMARHRVEMFDETFQTVVDWGLGLHIDMILMGRHCSPRAAGHGGAQSSIAFCDPEHGLAVAAVVNGMAGPAHHRRFEAILSALSVDLGLADEGDPGRDHNLPKTAV